MRTYSIIAAALLFTHASLFGLVQHPKAEAIYSARKAQALSEREQQLVGQWRGDNQDIQWEMDRKADGTYELILRETFEGETYVDYLRGVWGIRGENYFYTDLESDSPEIEPSGEPSSEKIESIDETTFVTLHSDPDMQPVRSREVRIDAFQFEKWKEYREAGPEEKKVEQTEPQADGPSPDGST